MPLIDRANSDDIDLLHTYNGKVCLDVVGGYSGTIWPIGTEDIPVKTLAEALTIMSSLGLDTLELKGDDTGSTYALEFTANTNIKLIGNALYEITVNGSGITVNLTGDVLCNDFDCAQGDCIIWGDIIARYGTIRCVDGTLSIYGDARTHYDSIVMAGVGLIEIQGKTYTWGGLTCSSTGEIDCYGPVTSNGTLSAGAGSIYGYSDVETQGSITVSTGVFQCLGKKCFAFSNFTISGAASVQIAEDCFVYGNFSNAGTYTERGALKVGGTITNTGTMITGDCSGVGTLNNTGATSLTVNGDLAVRNGNITNTTGAMTVYGNVWMDKGALSTSTGTVAIYGKLTGAPFGVTVTVSGVGEIDVYGDVYQIQTITISSTGGFWCYGNMNVRNVSVGAGWVGCDGNYMAEESGAVTVTTGTFETYGPKAHFGSITVSGAGGYAYCYNASEIWISSTVTTSNGTAEIDFCLSNAMPRTWIGGNIANQGTMDLGLVTVMGTITDSGTLTYRGLQEETAVNITAINASETDVFDLSTAGHMYIVRKLILKCVDPGANTVNVKLYDLVNGVSTNIATFAITTANFGTYFTLESMFSLSDLHGADLHVTVQATAGGPYAVTGSYVYEDN